MLELMKERHSVRKYLDKQIESEKKKEICDLIKEINETTALHIQACFDEKKAFDSFMAHYGKFENVTNYICLVGEKNRDEAIGYYGEKIVLLLQKLNLNSCWVAMTYSKKKAPITKDKGKKLYCVLAFGYGAIQGSAHKIKNLDEVSNVSDTSPEWFKKGVEAALLAPTAMNQQKFYFEYNNNEVKAKAKSGFYSKIDLGIVKYHFEVASQKEGYWNL